MLIQASLSVFHSDLQVYDWARNAIAEREWRLAKEMEQASMQGRDIC
jgi:hypothetical protein